MHTKLLLTFAPLLALAGCTVEVVNTDHCSVNEGDAYCGERFPERPFCNSPLRTDTCDITDLGFEVARFGCVSAEELRCPEPCGEDPTCETADSSGTGTGEDPSTSSTQPTTDTEPVTTGTDDSTTVGEPECITNDECLDSALPFCVDDACAPCTDSVDPAPDDACAALDAATPLCIDDACVQCSADATDACGGTTPLCDEGTNTCVACSFHEQCQDLGAPACNIATGACFEPAAVTEVNAGTPGSLQPAIDAIADGAEHAIVLTGGGQLHTVTIDGGKTIAIVSDSTSVREVRGNSGSPTLQVSGAGTTAYLHRVALTLNGDDVGVLVTSSATLYADSTRIAQNSGGGITLASGTTGFIRNCMVAGEGGNPGEPAISASNSNVDILYSTLGLTFNSGTAALSCSGGSVGARNSIIVSENNTPGSEIDCPGAVLDASAQRTTLSPSDWFSNFANGDYSLTGGGGAEFADIAVWQAGDPPFDFDGDARPSEDRASDFAGADVP